MHRLLKISFDQALMSLTPIATWFCLSLFLDKNLINVFSLVYPLQYIYYIINAPLGVGANISKIRDKNKHAVMSAFFIGILITLAVFGLIILHIDDFISFMNMDIATYHTFTIYAVVILMYQTIFSLVLNKLYYADQNRQANQYSLIFNVLSFFSVNGLALFTKNQILIVTFSLILVGLFLVYTVIRVWDKFKFRLNLFHCIKYNSVDVANYALMFFIFLFGLSNALEFGSQYALAITFVSLITDTQWDVLDAINTVAKIDITKKKFNYKISLRNAYKLTSILVGTSILMFLALYHFYDLNLPVTLTFLSLEYITFYTDPIYYLRTCYLQLNWSASKTTGNKIIARIFRFGLSMLPTPFCTSLGGFGSSVYQLITTSFLFRKNYLVDKNGIVRTRRRKTQSSAHSLPQPRYHNLPIDDN